MHTKFLTVFTALASLCITLLLVSCTPKTGAPGYDLYLLIGQSNMAGRAPLGDEASAPNARVMMLVENGQWALAKDPLHFDKPGAGIGPGLSFGKAMAALDDTAMIGLIPAAAGGSPIAAWAPGAYHDQTDSHPYDDAVEHARLAMKLGTLKGILWHQGESDANAETTPLYQENLMNLAANLRRDLGAPNVPFIVGGLGEFILERQAEAAQINAVLEDVSNFIPHAGFVSAKGLTDMGDGVHFSAQSARALGRLYGRKMQTLSHYKLVWADEFNSGDMPDPEKWNYRTGDGCPKLCSFGNGEWQWYGDAEPKNSRIENGRLIIEARKEKAGNADYTSARLNSRYKGDWLYGRFEIRAKMPSGRGTWPAIWMLPTDMSYGEWPKSGEIDIMEHVGHRPDEISGTVHTESFNHMIATHKGRHLDFTGSEDGFHIYGIDWTEQKIEFSIDDKVYFTFENTGKGSADYPFDKTFFMILNIAIGGNLGGQEGVDPKAFPTQMEIDYVRVYQRP